MRGTVEMMLRRLPDSVEVVILGVGDTPKLQQSANGYVWQGMLLTSESNGLRLGPQRLALPEAGFESFSFEGSGRVYRLAVTPVPGAAVSRPLVRADGRDLILSFQAPRQPRQQMMTPSLNTPGRVDQPSYVPPLQPRAVAPPVGDIAVGTMMLANPSFLNISGPPLSSFPYNGPAQGALKALSDYGGYSMVYVNDTGSGAATGAGATTTAAAASRQISLSLRNVSFSKAFNSVLLASGLQAKLQGNLIIVGPNVLGISFGAAMSKVFRLNQVSAGSAADYLASLGATINKINLISTSVTEGTAASTSIAGGASSATTQSSKTTVVENYAAAQGPLKGLLGATDSRLGTITLVGDPRLIAIAESYLRQLDLRQRQVALSVKILDVTLDNDMTAENSFAFRSGSNFIVNDRGQLIGSFNNLLPPDFAQFGAISQGGAPFTNPGQAYPNDNFFDLVRTAIIAGSTKVLASPTLILTDNPEAITGGSSGGGTLSIGGGGGGTIGRSRANEAFVSVGEQVITSYSVQAGQNGASATCQPAFTVAGLTFGARVSKIDDNGFVTFQISPSITASTRQQIIPNCGPVDILAIRQFDSGSARVRDGQTLIMTGVISDRNTTTVQKWPVLGDLPLVGQFFRQTANGRRKRELVILVTPKIIRDDEGGAYGYGYTPATPDSRELLRLGSNPARP